MHDNMKMVHEEACAGAPPDILTWPLTSFDNWIRITGNVVHAKATLMSGHRSTAFTNTAYMRWLRHDYFRLDAYHTGDDVLLLSDNPSPFDCFTITRKSPEAVICRI